MGVSVAAIVFDPGGDRLAAICPQEGKLRVWNLAAKVFGFSHASQSSEITCSKVSGLSPKVSSDKFFQ